MSNLIVFEADDTASEKSRNETSEDGSYESSFIDDNSHQSWNSSENIRNGKPVSIFLRVIQFSKDSSIFHFYLC